MVLNMNKTMNRFKKIIIFLLCFIIIAPIFTPVSVNAVINHHSSHVIIPRVDANSSYVGRYTFDVYTDENTFSKAYEDELGVDWFKVLSESDYSTLVSRTGEYDNNYSSQALFFSFPSHDGDKGFGKGGNNDYDDFSGDRELAYYVGETLTNGLNTVITKVDGLDGRMNIGVAELPAATQALASGVPKIQGSGGSVTVPSSNTVNEMTLEGGTSCKIVYCGLPDSVVTAFTTKDYNAAIKDTEGLSSKGKTWDVGQSGLVLYGYIIPSWADDYGETWSDESIIISKADENCSGKFVWAVTKGYLKIDGTKAPQVHGANTYHSYFKGSSTNIDEGGDATWMTIFDLAAVANYYNVVIKADSSVTEDDAGWLESLLFDIISGIVLGLKSLLGLEDISTLVYGRNANVSGGLMDNSWWSIVLKYHVIFQIVAWLSIGLAVAKVLIQINFAAINPQQRLSMIEQIQKFFLVGFLLALCIPTIRLLSDVNAAIVDIFATQAQGGDKAMFTIGGGLADVIAYLSYIGILCMVNCTYIMRSIMLAIFTASAPLFIVSMLFSKGKGFFDNWLKEIIANIFLQSIHAFAFTFLFEVIDTSKFLPKLVIFFSLMPITETFRSFIFGQSGGFTTKQGQAMGQFVQQNAQKLMNSSAKTAGSAAGAAVTHGMANDGFKMSQEVGGTSGGDTGEGINATTGTAGGAGKTGGGGRSGGTTGGPSGGQNMLTAYAQHLGQQGDPRAKTFAAAGHALGGMSGMVDQTQNLANAMTNIQMGQFGAATQQIGQSVDAYGDMAVNNAASVGGAIRSANLNRASNQVSEASANFQAQQSSLSGQEITAARSAYQEMNSGKSDAQIQKTLSSQGYDAGQISNVMNVVAARRQLRGAENNLDKFYGNAFNDRSGRTLYTAPRSTDVISRDLNPQQKDYVNQVQQMAASGNNRIERRGNDFYDVETGNTVTAAGGLKLSERRGISGNVYTSL